LVGSVDKMRWQYRQKTNNLQNKVKKTFVNFTLTKKFKILLAFQEAIYDLTTLLSKHKLTPKNATNASRNRIKF